MMQLLTNRYMHMYLEMIRSTDHTLFENIPHTINTNISIILDVHVKHNQ